MCVIIFFLLLLYISPIKLVQSSCTWCKNNLVYLVTYLAFQGVQLYGCHKTPAFIVICLFPLCFLIGAPLHVQLTIGYSQGYTSSVQPNSLAIHRLTQAVQLYFNAALSSSTQKTYKSAEKKYLSFCNSFPFTPIPTSEITSCYFAACLGQEGLACSSIRTYLSGVRQLQIAGCFSNPHINQVLKLSQVLKGIKIHVARTGHRSHPRLPITPAVLRKLRDVWLDNLMLWAAATNTFFSFCRSGDFTVELRVQLRP